MSKDIEFTVPEKAIKKLADLLKSSDLAELEIASGDLTIKVRAHEKSAPMIMATSQASSATAPSVLTNKPKADPVTDLHIIRSPFIGTFYRSPAPSSPSFVSEGQAVSKGQTLCIVEAMKMMNEIESDSAGTIEKVFVENGDAVEFNTPLFGIRR